MNIEALKDQVDTDQHQIVQMLENTKDDTRGRQPGAFCIPLLLLICEKAIAQVMTPPMEQAMQKNTPERMNISYREDAKDISARTILMIAYLLYFEFLCRCYSWNSST